MRALQIDPKMPVSEILDKYPETIAVFRDFGMRCADDSSYAAKTLEENFMTEKVNFMDLLGRLNKAVNPPSVAQVEPSPVEQKIMATQKAMQADREAHARKRSQSSPDLQGYVPANATGWLIAVYIFAILGGGIGLGLGLFVANRQVRLPDGRKAYKYQGSQRVGGMIGAGISFVMMILWKLFATDILFK